MLGLVFGLFIEEDELYDRISKRSGHTIQGYALQMNIFCIISLDSYHMYMKGLALLSRPCL